MELIGLVCVVTYCAVATVVAIRMLRLAVRTGELPELFIGASLLLGGSIGFPPLAVAPALAGAEPGLALRLGLAGIVALHLSSWSNALGWRAIFHPGDRWARYTAVVCTVLLFLSLSHRLAGMSTSILGGDPSAQFASGYTASLVAQAAPYCLMSFSAFRYRAKLRRRLALGLADPVVVNRIALWGATSGVVVVQYAISLATLHVRHLPEIAAIYQTVVAGLGLVLSVLLYLAFLPPKAYLRRVARRGGVAAAVEA